MRNQALDIRSSYHPVDESVADYPRENLQWEVDVQGERYRFTFAFGSELVQESTQVLPQSSGVLHALLSH